MTKAEIARLEKAIMVQERCTMATRTTDGAGSESYKRDISWLGAEKYIYFVLTGKHFDERTADNDCI